MIKKIIGGFKRWLNYSTVYELSRLNSITSQFEGGWVWESSDPQLLLVSRSTVPLKGFYMLELTATGVSKPLNASLYINEGNGFIDDNVSLMTIPATGNEVKVIKRICFFENHVKQLRFDPGDEPGSCGHLSISFVKLTDWKARRLMNKKRLSNLHIKDLTNKHSISELYSAYCNVIGRKATVSYKQWILENEIASFDGSNKSESFENNPLISIVCPLFNTKPAWLESCINSVITQSYPSWQLILVDDASTDKSHFDCVKEYCANDSRIQVHYLSVNSHISAATNAGIASASGDFITFLDHDDTLAANALAEIVQVINDKPDVKIIYSDEDLMSEAGERIAPHFKSDWNVELLRAHNYVTHLCCYDADLLKALGGMRLGYEGAQDYDLILRASALVKAEEVHHIAKVLYHWRMVEGSTALSSGAKSYATDAGLKALQYHISHNDIDATVKHATRDNFYTVNYALPSCSPKVSIVIPTRDGMEVLRPCIETLLAKTSYANYEVIILDNGSSEKETLDFLNELSSKPKFTVVRDDGEFNYSRINNHAVTYAGGELICLLNNDIEIIDPNWLTEMVSLAVRKEVGCVGAKLLYPDGTIQHAGVILGLGGYAAHSHRGLNGNESGYFCRAQVRQQLSAVTGACLLIKRDVFDEVGGLDESFQVAYNDVDFCLRVQQKGYQNIYTPFAELIHHESKTRGEDTSIEKANRLNKEKELLLTKWSGVIKNDPFYNLNLTRSREDFSIGQ